MRYGHGVGPRDALCHLHDKSRPDFVRNPDDFAIRLLSRRNLAHYCEEPIRKLRVISDYDDFGDLTSAEYPSATTKITRIEREPQAERAETRSLYDDRSRQTMRCGHTRPAILWRCGNTRQLPPRRSIPPIVTNETFRKSL
jgi:hypothetical protein